MQQLNALDIQMININILI